MRQIETAESKSRKERRNKIIVGVVLVLVMLVSTFGIITDSFGEDNSGKKEYNGIEFQKSENLWYAQKDGFILAVSYNPEQTEKLTEENFSLNQYYGKPLYVYSEDRNAEIEIYRNLNSQENKISERVQKACPAGKICEGNVPEKNCSSNFIIILQSNENRIAKEQNCVFIYGTNETILKNTDEFLFRLFSIK